MFLKRGILEKIFYLLRKEERDKQLEILFQAIVKLVKNNEFNYKEKLIPIFYSQFLKKIFSPIEIARVLGNVGILLIKEYPELMLLMKEIEAQLREQEEKQIGLI